MSLLYSQDRLIRHKICDDFRSNSVRFEFTVAFSPRESMDSIQRKWNGPIKQFGWITSGSINPCLLYFGLKLKKEIPVHKTQTWRIKLNVPIFLLYYVAEYLWLPAICRDLSNKYQCLCHVQFLEDLHRYCQFVLLKIAIFTSKFQQTNTTEMEVFWTGHLVVQALHMYFV